MEKKTRTLEQDITDRLELFKRETGINVDIFFERTFKIRDGICYDVKEINIRINKLFAQDI